MPVRRIQRRVGRPRVRDVRIARRVLEFVRRPAGVEAQRGKSADVGVEGVGFVDVEAPRVDFVQPETGIQVRQRRHARPDPAGRQRRLRILHGAVVRVVNHLLVLVRVPKKDVRDDVRAVAIDSLVKQIRRVGEPVRAIPAR